LDRIIKKKRRRKVKKRRKKIREALCAFCFAQKLYGIHLDNPNAPSVFQPET